MASKTIRFKYESLPQGAHRVAWKLIFGPIPKGQNICHRCDEPSCVNPKHLFLGSHADNVADRVTKNRSAVGKKNGNTKLKAESVFVIRQKLQQKVGVAAIAKEYNVDESTVRLIRDGKIWQHLL